MFNLPDTPILFHNACFTDERGTLSVIEKPENLVSFTQVHQCFVRSTKKNVLRGLHYQDGHAAQAKIVTCMTGIILDYTINIDKRSEEFGKVWCYKLDKKNSLFIPKHYAHGYLTLTRDTLVHYAFDNYFDKKLARTINFFDKKLKLKLPVEKKDVLMSPGDANADSLSAGIFR